jgi:hypothetical protein
VYLDKHALQRMSREKGTGAVSQNQEFGKAAFWSIYVEAEQRRLQALRAGGVPFREMPVAPREPPEPRLKGSADTEGRYAAPLSLRTSRR